ncbi:MAG: creatininase family protein [Gammaproteobacteria bacterium]|nr:creatininase family protein [Gammaproteobacteria bacterium]
MERRLRSGYWQNLTTRDFAGLDAESVVALLPVAAIEAHGPHLPLSTDAVINEGIVRRALEKLPASPALLVLPALSVGHSLEHTGFAGTLSTGFETLLGLWLDVGRSVARTGVRKLVILNTHGGQRSLVDVAALRLRAECAMLAVRANYFAFGAPGGLFDERELRHGLHGGDAETSLMLHLRPDLVRVDALEAFGGLPERLEERLQVLGVEKPIGIGWMSQDLHPQGVCGNAAAADADKGEEYLEYIVDALIRLVVEVGAMPLDQLRE